MRNLLAQLWYKIAFVSLIALAVSILLPQSHVDLLAYIISGPTANTALMLYDPHHRLNVPLLTHIEFSLFNFGANGNIAYSAARKGQIEILNIYSPNIPPVFISQNATSINSPLAWSRDGRYLAFQSFQENPRDLLLYIWDGEKSINITPTDMDDIADRYYDASWSSDGWLAFSVGFGVTSTYQPSEVYLWDGSKTTNLSQNPAGEDHAPTWSADGRLAYVSQRNKAYEILIWDRGSVKTDASDSFINVSPALTGSYSFPAWTNTGQLAFEGGSQENTQVYLWDGETATNISQTRSSYNGGPRWSQDGRWAFVNFFLSQLLINVRDSENHPLLRIQAQTVPAWNADGDLIFCRAGLVLSMWDGQQITEIARGGEIYAQWQSGSHVSCASR